MNFRTLLLGTMLAAGLVPVGASADHCTPPPYIYIFSSTRVQTDVDDPTNPGTPIGRNVPSANPSAVGCTATDVIADPSITDDPTVHPLTNTDVIYPNSNRLSVRFFENGRDPSVLSKAELVWAGETIVLEMEPGIDPTDPTGQAPADWLHSKSIVIDPADTVVPNTAVATFCVGEDCYSRTYRTLAG